MIYIRADANSFIASGHVMRCISIAKELEKQNKQVMFLTADQDGSMLIEEKGFTSQCLFSDYCQLEKELPKLCSILKTEQAEGIIVDSYFVTKTYLNQLKQLTNVIYIDDKNAFTYPVDMLVQYGNPEKASLYQERYQGTKVELLLGSQYIPLREEFQDIKPIVKEVTDILITTGGSDTYHFCGKFIAYLSKHYSAMLEKFQFHIIVGAYNTFLPQLQQLEAYHKTVILHQNIKDMSIYMKQADIAISAGGTTLYELCACGTPAISFTIADNQMDGAKYLHEQGLIFYSGDMRGNKEEENKLFEAIVKQITYFETHEAERKKIAQQMQELVDGKGAKAIALEIIKLLEKKKRRF